MRYLRYLAILIFACAIIFSSWVNYNFKKDINTDYPQISCENELLELSVEDGPEALLQGLRAYDETDGDISDKIMVASKSHFLDSGRIKVKYVVFDSHNNSSSYTREVIYSDYHSPRFSLNVPLVYVRGDNADFLTYLIAIDPLEGNISDRIKVVSSQISNYVSGKYPISLEVTNSYGITEQLNLWVAFLDKDTRTAEIRLDNYIAYIEPNKTFDPYEHILSVTAKDGTKLDPAAVSVMGGVDQTRPGFYELTYSYDDGIYQSETYLTVVVPETEIQK